MSMEDIKLDGSIIISEANRTITDPYKALAELITNCDDSYKRMGKKEKGNIDIIVEVANRKLKRLVIKDNAEGMGRKELETALCFGAQSSGFTKKNNVRGNFGKGLKETCVALGKSSITSVKDGVIHETVIAINPKTKKPAFDNTFLNRSRDTRRKDGTTVDIKVSHPKMNVPKKEKFIENLSRYYALDDILKNRNVTLTYKSKTEKTPRKIKIKTKETKGTEVFRKKLTLDCGDKVELVLYESDKILTEKSPKYDPFSSAGITIRTNGACLDKTLFKFNDDPAAFFFYGEVYWENLSNLIRAGKDTEGILNQNRLGLNWKHELSKDLATHVEQELEVYVNEKKKSFNNVSKKDLDKETIKKLDNVLTKINKFALERGYEDNLRALKKELGNTSTKEKFEISNMFILPNVKNIPVNENFYLMKLYCPKSYISMYGKEITLKCNTQKVRYRTKKITLQPHPDFKNVFFANIELKGIVESENVKLTATLGNAKKFVETKAMINVVEKREKTSRSKRGFIKGLQSDVSKNPSVRSRYTDGYLYIYTNSPSFHYLNEDLTVKNPFGWIEIAEAMSEAICKEFVLKGIDNNSLFMVEGSEADSVFTHFLDYHHNNILPLVKKDLVSILKDIS